MDKENRDYIAIVLLVCLSICFFIRCFFSFNWSDEAFYLSTVHRLWIGEKMFADEWYTTQLSAPVLLPFYAIYEKIAGNNEGIYLYFRILYWGISTAVAFFTYIKLKKWNKKGISLVCALVYMCYSRGNIGGMSYYNMTITCVLVAMLLLYDQYCAQNTKPKDMVGTGVILALAVTFNPYMVLIYLVAFICLIVKRKKIGIKKDSIYIFGGILITGIVYCIYVFSNASFKEVIENIPYILNEPALQKTNPIMVLPLIVARIIWRYKWTIWITIILSIYTLKKKKEVLTQSVFRKICIIDFFVFAINAYLSSDMIGCINIAAVLFFLPICLAIFEKKSWNREKIGFFILPGVGISIAFSFSSNTGLDAMAIGFVLILIGLLLQIAETEQSYVTKFYQRIERIVITIVLAETVVLRIFSVFRDAPLLSLNTQIHDGPAKFLYTTAEHAEQYDKIKKAITKYVRAGDKVFFSRYCCWCYLCTDNEYGVSTSWRMAFDDERLAEYYQLKPEKIPTCIFILNPVYGDYISSMIQGNEREDRPNENNIDGFLKEYIDKHNYESIEVDCGIIYRKGKA